MTQQYFDFTNDLIFRWVMEREENCLAILRAILPELKITAVKRRKNEHPVNYLAFDDERGVRFDAIIEDDRERFYDVEMQVANQLGLGKRVRYYQSQIDQETLKKSEHYDALRKSYVIFFCAFDPCTSSSLSESLSTSSSLSESLSTSSSLSESLSTSQSSLNTPTSSS